MLLSLALSKLFSTTYWWDTTLASILQRCLCEKLYLSFLGTFFAWLFCYFSWINASTNWNEELVMICRLSGIEGFGFVRIKFFTSPLHKVMLYSYPSLLAFEWQSIFYSPPLHSVSDDWSFLRPPWKPWISPKKSSNRPPLPPLHIYPPLPSREKSWLVLYLIVTAIYSPNETDWQTPTA